MVTKICNPKRHGANDAVSPLLEVMLEEVHLSKEICLMKNELISLSLEVYK